MSKLRLREHPLCLIVTASLPNRREECMMATPTHVPRARDRAMRVSKWFSGGHMNK